MFNLSGDVSGVKFEQNIAYKLIWMPHKWLNLGNKETELIMPAYTTVIEDQSNKGNWSDIKE